MMLTHSLIKVRNLDLFSGIALNNLGKFNEAIEMYDRALQINSNSSVTYHNKG